MPLAMNSKQKSGMSKIAVLSGQPYTRDSRSYWLTEMPIIDYTTVMNLLLSRSVTHIHHFAKMKLLKDTKAVVKSIWLDIHTDYNIYTYTDYKHGKPTGMDCSLLTRSFCEYKI